MGNSASSVNTACALVAIKVGPPKTFARHVIHNAF
jgi:hypothetical protein